MKISRKRYLQAELLFTILALGPSHLIIIEKIKVPYGGKGDIVLKVSSPFRFYKHFLLDFLKLLHVYDTLSPELQFSS